MNFSKNYRSVAFTSHLIKILGKNIHHFLETNQKMNPKQHGFRPADPASPRNWRIATRERNCKRQTMFDVIYLDFAKAFAKIDRGILLNKLKKNRN